MLKNGNDILIVAVQDSSPPSVVRMRFVAAGIAACGCNARSNSQMRAAGGDEESGT